MVLPAFVLILLVLVLWCMCASHCARRTYPEDNTPAANAQQQMTMYVYAFYALLLYMSFVCLCAYVCAVVYVRACNPF